jgi:hypothetical protein
MSVKKAVPLVIICVVALAVLGSWWVIRGQTSQTPGGTVDPDISVDIYDSGKAYPGTTIFADMHETDRPRIIEVNMQGEIVWEYVLPNNLKQYTNPGFDVEVLSDNHVLFVLPLKGVYEIDRSGDIVWSYLDSKVSHDADRLPNGNTLVIWGGGDSVDDNQVKEVNPQGQVVWSWRAKENFYHPPYDNIWDQGWTHANAATRMANGNTLVNLRNFNLTVEVNPSGQVVWSYDWSVFGDNADPHEPELEPDNHIVIALQNNSPYQIVEINRATGENVWTYENSNLRTTRDADRLPNGNTLIVTVYTGAPGGESRIMEITQDKEVVWQLGIKNAPVGHAAGWIYKADRLS